MQSTLLSFCETLCCPKLSVTSTRRLSTGGGQGNGWPPALLEWVDRAFGRCQQPQQRQFVDAGLKATVKQAQEVRATLCMHVAFWRVVPRTSVLLSALSSPLSLRAWPPLATGAHAFRLVTLVACHSIGC